MTLFAAISLFLCGAAFQQALDGEVMLGLSPTVFAVLALVSAVFWAVVLLAKVAP